MKSVLCAVAFIAGVLGFSVSTLAGTAQDARKLFPKGKDACFVSVAGSFAEGTNRPTEIFISNLTTEPDTREGFPRSSKVIIKEDKGLDYPTLDFYARLDGNPFAYSQFLVCSDGDKKNRFFCGVECDGGGFDFTPRSNGVVLSFETASSVIIEGGCDGEGGVETRGLSRSDLKRDSFDLVAVEPQQCAAVAKEARPDYAADPVPLRTRIEEGEFDCLKRVYSSEELAAASGQQVAAVAVKLLTRPVKGIGEESGSTSFSMSYEFKLRNGEKLSGKDTCNAYGFEFSCGEHFRLRRRDAETARLLPGNYADEAGIPGPMNGVKFGKSDQIFKLFLQQDSACSVD